MHFFLFIFTFFFKKTHITIITSKFDYTFICIFLHQIQRIKNCHKTFVFWKINNFKIKQTHTHNLLISGKQTKKDLFFFLLEFYIDRSVCQNIARLEELSNYRRQKQDYLQRCNCFGVGKSKIDKTILGHFVYIVMEKLYIFRCQK